MEQYVKALLARQQAIDYLEAIRGRIHLNQQEINQLLSAGCTAVRAAQAHQFQRLLDKQQEDRIATLALAERRVNAAFQAMIQARQQLKVVENYRDKQVAKYERDVLREDQKLLDDLASRRTGSILSWNPSESLS